MEIKLSKFKRICVFCGSSPGKKNTYKEAAIELGMELVIMPLHNSSVFVPFFFLSTSLIFPSFLFLIFEISVYSFLFGLIYFCFYNCAFGFLILINAKLESTLIDRFQKCSNFSIGL